MIFKVKKQEQKNKAEILFVSKPQALLNDGLGTEADLTTKGAVFDILVEIPEVSKDEWQKELEKDKIPPESFKIEISQDPSIFEGRYFIAFSTTDKQTGLDYYEIKEGERDWKKIESPYLLEDQELQSIIKVKVVDKAGNERIAEYIPEITKKQLPWWLIILIAFGIIIWAIWQKIFKK